MPAPRIGTAVPKSSGPPRLPKSLPVVAQPTPPVAPPKAPVKLSIRQKAMRDKEILEETRKADEAKAQPSLFTLDEDWKKLWVGMPGYEQKDLMPHQSIYVHFDSVQSRAAFAELVGQTITDLTKSIWYPKAVIGRTANKRWIGPKVSPRYPVYIISKGRWESRLTAKSLEEIGVPYYIAIEPQEFDQYAAVIDPANILVLPFSNLGLGSIPARNFCWDHSAKNGFARHWCLDDNINGFYRLQNNLKVKVTSGAIFRAAEDFSDRYANVGLSGFNYFMFAPRKSVFPPFTLNTRIYSMFLINNSVPHRWRGRWNEDTDLSLQVLKDGMCTILFNAFLGMKSTTNTMKGGNTGDYNAGEFDQKRLESTMVLKNAHPDVVTVTRKWGRWHHHVDYSLFERNQLIPDPSFGIQSSQNDYGMTLQVSDAEEPKDRLNAEELARWNEICERLEQGGNDGADVYEAECWSREMETKYGKPINELT